MRIVSTLILILFFALPAFAQAWNRGCGVGGNITILGAGQCACYVFTDATASNALFVGGNRLQIHFESDAAGATSTADVLLTACTNSADATACGAYQWDTNGDGIVDTNRLTGDTANQRGIQGAEIAGWLRATPDGTYSGTSHLLVCASR